MRKLTLTAFVLSFLIFESCRKNHNDKIFADEENELAETSHAARGGDNEDCDYSEASSRAVSADGTQKEPLFKKFYDASGKIERVLYNFLDLAGGGYPPNYLDVTHSSRHMTFLFPGRDTALLLTFDRRRRLTQAQHNFGFPHGGGGGPFINGDNPRLYRFYYHGAKLSEIKIGELSYNGSEVPPFYDTVWYKYIKVTYDRTNKNVSKVYFFQPGQDVSPDWIKYEYDYSRKANAQFYADERVDRFYYLLRYLNLFPELNPENILVKSFQKNSEYPGDEINKYRNHKIDRSGKLIYYEQYGGIHSNEQWIIDWKCLHSQKPFHN